MRLTGPNLWGPPPDRPACERLLRTAAEHGVSVFDTAVAYGPGVSDELLATSLAPAGRDDLTIVAKVGLERPGPHDWVPAGRAEALRAACERSLRRLRVEAVDLLLLHTLDPEVPLEESVGALADLVTEGRAKAMGVSNVDSTELSRARAVAEIAAVQNHLNLRDREHLELARECAEEGIAFLAWWPLRGGALLSDAELIASATGLGLTPAQGALAWIHAGAPDATSIVGFTSEKELLELLATPEGPLHHEAVAALSASAS